jgi:hypothetical protein
MHEVCEMIIKICLNDLKNIQEQSNIRDNELHGDYIERNIKGPGNSIGKIQKSQEDIYYDSYEDFLSFHDAPLHYTPRPSMDLQDSSKGTSSKRKKVSS